MSDTLSVLSEYEKEIEFDNTSEISEEDNQSQNDVTETKDEEAKVKALIRELGNQKTTEIINNELSTEEKNKLDEATEKLRQLKEEKRQIDNKKQEDLNSEKAENESDKSEDEKDDGLIMEDDSSENSLIMEEKEKSLDKSQDMGLQAPIIDDNIQINLDNNNAQIEAISRANERALNFRPKKMKRKTKVGFFGRISQAIGYTIASTIGVLLSVVGGVIGRAVNSIKRSSHRRNMTPEDRGKIQQKLSYNSIPGRNGETFKTLDISNDADQDIFDDVRRVPMVWERVIADNPKEEPIFQVNAAVQERDAKSEKDSAHSFITLYYTKRSKVSGKDIRYKLSFGFYPKGGVGVDNVTMGVTGSYMPGSIQDEFDTNYMLSKRYKINNRQINIILRHAEGYAQGGYDVFQRNCTTFVADMGKTAGIDVSNDLKRENMSIGAGYMLLPFYNVVARYKRNVAANNMEKRIVKKDSSYQQFGQNMFSQEDIDRTLSTGNYGFINPNAYTPAKAFDTLRSNASDQYQLSGGEGIEFMRFSKPDIDEDDKPFVDQADEILLEMSSVLMRILTDEEDQVSQSKVMTRFIERNLNLLSFDPNTASTITENMAEVNKFQADLQKWYFGVVGGDKRLWDYFLNINGVLEAYKEKYNDIYRTLDTGEVNRDYTLMKQSKLVISKESGLLVDLPRELIPGYIKFYGSYSKAALKIGEYEKISSKNKARRSADEQRRYEILKREKATIEDFAKSEKRYAMSDNLDDYDLRYAFREVVDKEREGYTKGKLNSLFVSKDVGSGFLQGAFYSRYFSGATEMMENAVPNDSKDNNLFITAVCRFIKDRTIANISESGQDLNQFEKAMSFLLEDILSKEGQSQEDRLKSMNEILTKSIWYNYMAVLYYEGGLASRLLVYTDDSNFQDAIYKDLIDKIALEKAFEPLITRLIVNKLNVKESA